MPNPAYTPTVGGAAAVKVALLESKDLRPNERLVLVAIAAHTNRDGDAWPSVATIAEYAGVSVRTVQRALAKLVQLGRLVVRQVATVATRVYRLVTGHPAGGDIHGQGVTNGGPGGDSQGGARRVEDQTKMKRPAGRSWRDWIKPNHPRQQPHQRQPYGPSVRRGAALPVAPRADQCPSHRGNSRIYCGPCRSERLAGGV
jgi:hypothetical protein